MSVSRNAASKLWLYYLLVGAVVLIGYYLVPATRTGVLIRVVLYCLVSVSAACAVFAGLRGNRPQPRRPWVLLGLSQLVYASADAYFYIAHYVVQSTAYPSIADALYLSHYPLVVTGLVLLIRRRTPGRDLPGLLDAAVLAVVAGMLSWLYVIGPQARLDSPTLVKLASLGYPVMDLAMLAVALRLILGAGRRPRAFFLLSGNLLAMMAADTIYVLQQLSGTFQAGNFLDAIWLSGNLLLGAAALHPTMGKLAERSPVRDSNLGPARIAALSVAALIAPATLLVQHLRGSLREVPVIAAACAILFVLTIARLACLVSDQRRLAITDGLTGLHTRRFFEAQLPLEVARARRSEGSVAVFIIDVDHFKSINDKYGHPTGDRVLIEIAARLRSAIRAGEVLSRYGGEEFALLVPNASPAQLPVIADRLREQVANEPIVVSPDEWVVVTVSVGTASFPLHGEDPHELVSVADRALYTAKATGRDRIVVGAVPTPSPGPSTDHALVDYLCQVADQVDGWLSNHEHSRAIGRWTTLMASEFGHPQAVVRCAELAGRLHDIGKIVIPEAVLTKPGPLTDEEWQLVRQHPDFGFRLARMIPGYTGVAHVIRQHHERYDGAGYPDRIAGRGIRVEARILAVCDSWAAMRSDRPYQAALDEDHARQELRAGRGTQFDPDAVDMFLDLHQRGLIGDLRRIRPEGRTTAEGLILPAPLHP